MTIRFGSRSAWLVLWSILVGTAGNGLAQTPGVIVTVAGTGQEGYGGDGRPATAAQLRSPCCVAVDAAGNLFISDTGNHRIRKIRPDGTITTVAGSDKTGYGGDGGPATAALLAYPGCAALDVAGNLFISDASNHRIRKVSPDGNISTVAGSDKTGYDGDGGPATAALLAYPEGVAVDSAGNLFIADAGNHRIRKVSSNGNISTVAGAGKPGSGGDGGPATAALLSYPSRVAVDSAGNLFIADAGNHRIRKVSSTNGNISTVAGTGEKGYKGDEGPAASAWLLNPFGLAVDSAGNLFIADTGNSRIRKVSSTNGNISTVAGTEGRGYSGEGAPASAARLNSPFGIAVDFAGNLFIADTMNDRVRNVVGPGATTCTLACSATALTSASTEEQIPFSATAVPQGCTGGVSYDWSFGDGGRSSLQNPTHAYTAPGSFAWTMTARAGAALCSRSGSIVISVQGAAHRVRIRALDEARTPPNVSTFPGQTLYWHYAMETEAGTPAPAATVSVAITPVGFSPSPGAFAFQMEEAGHLVVKTEVDGLNLTSCSSGCSFSFRIGADAVTLDGQPYELVEAPPAVSLSLGDPPIVDAWDVFGELAAGATGCLGACGQAGDITASVAAARLSGPLSGGAGMRLEQDRRQLHRAGRGISLRRRFSLASGAGLIAPAFEFPAGPREEGSIPVGASTGGSYGFTGSQAVSYGGDSEKEARLVHAAFTLESLSLAGVPLSPVAGVMLLATLESLNGLSGGAHSMPASRKEWTAGTTLEGKLSPDVGYPGLWSASSPPRLVLGGTMTGVLEQQAGVEFGPESSVQNYVSRIRWAGGADGETVGDFGDAGRFGSAAVALLSGARAFEYGHQLRLSPSLEAASFETFLGATAAQNRLDLEPYTDQSLETVTLRYRYAQPDVAAALCSSIPAVAALSHLAGLVAPAQVESFTVGTLAQTAEQIEPERNAALGATKAVAYEVTSDVASTRRVSGDAGVSISIPAAGRSFDLGLHLITLRERKLVEVSRSVAAQGREWKTAEYRGHPEEASMPALADLLRDEIFAGLGPWIEEAWQRRVASVSAIVPPFQQTLLEVPDRVTKQLVATLNVSPYHVGKTIRVLSYSADRPEATGTSPQGVVTAAQWRYTTSRIAGKSSPPGPLFASAPSNYLRVVGNVVDLTVLSTDGTPLTDFQPPLAVEFPLDPARLAKYGVDAAAMARVGLYRYDEGAREWSAVTSGLPAGGQTLQAQLLQPGVYAPGLEITIPAEDSDRDGMPASQEDLDSNGVLDPGETHPYVWDTDGDGVSDGEERRLGTDPTSAASHPNRAPVLGFVGNQTVRVGSTLELQLAAYDEDGDSLVFSASTLPPGAEFDASSGWFRWTPAAAGEHAVEFRVSDGALSQAATVLLTAYLETPALGTDLRRWRTPPAGARPRSRTP